MREMGITELDGRKYNINFVACDEELAWKTPYLFHFLIKQVQKVWIWKRQLKEMSFHFHGKGDHDGYSRSEEEDREGMIHSSRAYANLLPWNIHI